MTGLYQSVQQEADLATDLLAKSAISYPLGLQCFSSPPSFICNVLDVGVRSSVGPSIVLRISM